MNNSMVYIVISNDIAPMIHGVFFSKEKAEQRQKAISKHCYIIRKEIEEDKNEQ